MKVTAKRKRESALLLELQNDHGYSLIDPPKHQQISMMFAKNGKRTTLTPFRIVKLAVPLDSALAKALKKVKPSTTSPKAVR